MPNPCCLCRGKWGNVHQCRNGNSLWNWRRDLGGSALSIMEKIQQFRAALAGKLQSNKTLMRPYSSEPPVEPFQLWLKERCLWAEAHQKFLFFALLLLAALIGLIAGAAHGLPFHGVPWPIALYFLYILSAAMTGAVAACRNRHLWGWGLLGGLLPGISMAFLLLRPVQSSPL